MEANLTYRYHRLVAASAVAVLFTACTEAVPMHRRDAIEMREFHDDMRVRLNNGKTLETKRMTVTESSVTIYRLKKETLDPPMVIPTRDVDTIERFQYDSSNTIATVATLGLLGFVVWLAVNFAL